MTANPSGICGSSNLMSMPMSQKPSASSVTSNSSMNIPDFSSSQAYTTPPNNTTVFIGGLTPKINEAQLQALFSPFGNILTVKIPQGKNCGFVKYENRIDAEAAIQGMQGFIVGGNPVRLSWGRNTVASGSSNNVSSNLPQMTSHHYIPQQSYSSGPQYVPMRHASSNSPVSNQPLDPYQNISRDPMIMQPQQQLPQASQQVWTNGMQWNNMSSRVYRETPMMNQQNVPSMLPQQQYPRAQYPMMSSVYHGFDTGMVQNPSGITLTSVNGKPNDVPPIHPSVLR